MYTPNRQATELWHGKQGYFCAQCYRVDASGDL
jgi:hypothetical protein